MKQYLAIAVLLGVIAFASVSFLAQADQQQPFAGGVVAPQAGKPMDPSKAPVMVTAPVTPLVQEKTDNSEGEADSDKAEVADALYQKDEDTCMKKAPSDDDGSFKESIDYRSCLLGKGHSQQEIKAHTDAENAADAATNPDAHDQGEHPAE
jgi:hypothetical protein